MSVCMLCPRSCGADRENGEKGYCRMTANIRAARAALHRWEEPCICGAGGSGTVFFSGCTLRCVFCQNSEIAAGNTGKVISEERLSEIFLELQDKGADNINLVTPSHYVPQIITAVNRARGSGLILPVVYNTGGYESVETLKMLEGIVDIYLPDMKYVSREASFKYSNAPDYFEAASKALEEMFRQVGSPVFDENGLMTRGMIVRHLILPGLVNDSKAVIKYLYETFGDNIYISIMNQYTPLPQVEKYPELNRKVTRREYDEVVDYAIELGVVNGYIQEGDTASESFIPSFDSEGI